MLKAEELQKLNLPTPDSEKKYRPGSTFQSNGTKYARMLTYVDARYVQDKLDKIVGVANWSNTFFRDEKLSLIHI